MGTQPADGPAKWYQSYIDKGLSRDIDWDGPDYLPGDDVA
jgi:hypothetical protein